MNTNKKVYIIIRKNEKNFNFNPFIYSIFMS